MTQFLPPNLLALFEARPSIPYLPPAAALLVEKNSKLPECRFGGISKFISQFEDPADTPPKPVVETKEERKERKQKEKKELLAYKLEQGIAQWNPAENSKATEDPYKTLFVARINYETSESKLKREMEQYGKIKRLSMVHDHGGKPRGYAFVEYSSKEDMHNAYKRADGQKIDGRRITVDYERGRTQKSWLPRRLGGGKGDTRRARESRKALEEKEEANGVDGFRERDRDRGNYERRDRDRSDRNGGGGRRRSRSRERDGRKDYRDERGGGGRGGYRGGPPTVASYASGAGGSGGGRDYRGGGGGYGGGGGGGGYGNGRDNYSGGGGGSSGRY